MMEYIIVGAGFAGATLAERIANDLGQKVLLLDKRDHIGGNAYDYYDAAGILCHKYGPHLFHTDNREVWEYISQFSEWVPYEHRVLGKIDGVLVPIPFNLTSIEICFDSEKSQQIKNALLEEYAWGQKIGILDLKQSKHRLIRELAEMVYEKVFLHYTMKQWGIEPDRIDPAVTRRVPVLLSKDDRYFQDVYQYMPKYGYTKVFEKMLRHPNIEIMLNTEAKSVLTVDTEKQCILYKGKPFRGCVIFTGPIDELLDYRFGELNYRSLEFELETYAEEFFQPVGTVNYPSKEPPYTRITEFKHLTGQKEPRGVTTIAREFPVAYRRNSHKGNIPYYPVFTEISQANYKKYFENLRHIPNLYLVGRLAEYKYYNMDAVIGRALDVYKKEIKANASALHSNTEAFAECT